MNECRRNYCIASSGKNKRKKKEVKVIGRKRIRPSVQSDATTTIAELLESKEYSFTLRRPPFELMIETPKKRTHLCHHSHPEALDGQEHCLCKRNRIEHFDDDEEYFELIDRCMIQVITLLE